MVGDVTSSKPGTGARFNTGKPDLGLIPPRMLPATSCVHAELLAALHQLMFHGSLDLLEQWLSEEMRHNAAVCASVFEYGKRKYAARGECTCPGGDKAKRRRAEVLAETNMKSTSDRPEELGEYFAIPATSALDFSKGLTAGLNEHSPTCGVHKVTGGAWNWAKGMPWSVPLASALRHAHSAWVEGEELDSESGLPHIGHILCNVVMLLHYAEYYRDGNDLPYKVLRNEF